MASATATPKHHLVSSEDLQGKNVYGLDNNKVGEIDHLMIDTVSGRVTYAVMSFGGFLGLAHSYHPIPWATLKYDPAVGGYRTGTLH
jgi:sporulation protein YlmC with PRC-barrel domain